MSLKIDRRTADDTEDDAPVLSPMPQLDPARPIIPLNDARFPQVIPETPPPGENRVPTLQDMYARAKESPIPKGIAYWIFLEAKARGRHEVAAANLKRLHDDYHAVFFMAADKDRTSQRQIVLSNAPDYIEFHKASTALSDAAEQLSVCARMIELLKGK